MSDKAAYFSLVLYPVFRPTLKCLVQFSSVQFSRSVVSDFLRPHESLLTRPPCTSPTPRVHSDSHSSSQWCHPAISSSVVPFSSCPQSLPASESFPMSQLFPWGSQSTGVSALLKTRLFILETGSLGYCKAFDKFYNITKVIKITFKKWTR